MRCSYAALSLQDGSPIPCLSVIVLLISAVFLLGFFPGGMESLISS